MMMKRRGALCALLLAVLSACGSEDEMGQVRGHVTTEAGDALAGVQVRVDGTNTVATSNSLGEFTLPDLKPGGHTLVAAHPDYVDSSQPVQVQAGATAEVSLKLVLALGKVTGTVQMEDSSAPAGVVVSIAGTDLTAVTDARGAFTFPSVLPGARTVVARMDHYQKASRNLVVVRDENPSVDLVLVRDGAPEVTVPLLSVQGGVLTITGGPFGRARGESTVTVGGVPVVEYVSWTDDKVVARVAASLASGNQPVVVTMGASWRPAVRDSVRVLRARTVFVEHFRGMGIRPDGTLVTWGRWGSGSEAPTQEGGLVDVASSAYFSVAVKGDGSPVVWGNGASNLQPHDVHDGVAVACAGYSCFVLRADGTVIRLSLSKEAELGDAVPQGLADVVAIDGGLTHMVAVTMDGRVVAWGGNEYTAATVPANLTDVAEVAATGNHTVVLKRDGTVTGFGSNLSGEGSPPSDLSEVVSVGGGTLHGYALTKAGQVRCWGNGYGTCDLPAEAQSQVARVVSVKDGVWGLVLKQDGTLVSWKGDNVHDDIPPPQGLVLAVPPL
ncbi:carboxypeptidase regulatory-like domain-containing protein [Corallococcus macrosporus]|uniref:Carboxypeptidase regulatory-like domain-containing protein n=1 Tax=Corallococcus macrosporus TaxID=35 RepID=A0ABS3D8F8_9BACT|nr:carboxypeptidase regulatory-like domain-containing protein [Corallococcus macrosporus]MBN8226937.1 carboxypeptidase regulatory-like domain-containing protein [Corallococcus macrosporus]